MDVMPPANDPIVPRAALEHFLRELPNYVVLRNYEDLFGNLQRGGDIDLLVGDLELAQRMLIRHLGLPIRIMRSSYVAGYSYDWGHIDLVPTVEWRGACYLSTETVLENRRLSTTGRPVPRIAHEALISWVMNLLFAGSFKARYAADIRRAVEIDGAAFRQALIDVAGKRLGLRLWQAAADGRAEISAEWTPFVRLAVWCRACFRSPVHTTRRFVAYVIAEFRLRFTPSVPWVAILGADRFGKSSFANELVGRFADCPYAKVLTFQCPSRHLHGVCVTPLIAADPTACRQSTDSSVRFLVSAAEWVVGYWTRWVGLRAKGYILAFDGMHVDPVAGARRNRSSDAPRLARALRWLLPKPDLVFLLDSGPGVLPHLKHQGSRSGVAREMQAHRVVVRQSPRAHVLNGTLPLTDLVDEVQRVIRTWIFERSTASLGDVDIPLRTAACTSAERPCAL
jgi:thymidylate kinase